MQMVHNQIIHISRKDDDFILSALNGLEASQNDNVRQILNKHRDTWEEDEFEDNVNILIEACTKNFNNI